MSVQKRLGGLLVRSGRCGVFSAGKTMAEQQSVDALGELLGPYARLAEEYLRRWLIEPGTPPALGKAMRYCVFSGGKRLRPALVLMAAEALGTRDYEELTRRAAAAVELVHCYSLVHDDLAAMDDDALRRGRPTAQCFEIRNDRGGGQQIDLRHHLVAEKVLCDRAQQERGCAEVL